jgi:GTP-binding protein HflX
VFNKLDLLTDDERRDLLVGERDAIGISAVDGEGVESLLDAIEEAFAETLQPMELLIPYDHGAILSELHAVAGQVERDDREDGVLVRARVPRSHSHRFAGYSVNGTSAA